MKLCVVTDIHARPTAPHCLSAHLPATPDVTRLALNDLCGRPDLTGEPLHQHLFQQGGIDTAARALARALPEGTIGLGFSAGGTALWRAAALGAQFAAVFCVSSTRLRNEGPIATPNHVFFGAEDRNRPAPEWLATVPQNQTVFPGADHGFYLCQASDAARATGRIILQAMQNPTRLSAGA